MRSRSGVYFRESMVMYGRRQDQSDETGAEALGRRIYVLDYHTVSSTPTGDPYYRFDTKRTELGELLFQLKYRAGGSVVVADIVDTAEQFVE